MLRSKFGGKGHFWGILIIIKQRKIWLVYLVMPSSEVHFTIMRNYSHKHMSSIKERRWDMLWKTLLVFGYRNPSLSFKGKLTPSRTSFKKTCRKIWTIINFEIKPIPEKKHRHQRAGYSKYKHRTTAMYVRCPTPL